ncbi:MAG: acetyl-CoA carboxylase biotin carboxyl carrier protein subunit, partial [Clostridiaceae bacterium]
MIIDVKSPTLGIIGKIFMNAGDSVTKGDELLSVETNKGNTVVKAKNQGIIEEILVSEGSEAKAGDILIKIKEEEKAQDTCKIDKICLEEESDIT